MTFLEWLARVGSVQGLAWAFLAGFLGITLYVAVIVVQQIRYWVPLRMRSALRRDNHIVKSLDKISDTLACMHDNSHDVKEGLQYLSAGIGSYAERASQRLDIKSDTLMYFRNAQNVLQKQPRRPAHLRPTARVTKDAKEDEGSDAEMGEDEDAEDIH
jgi:hypothetical protein